MDMARPSLAHAVRGDEPRGGGFRAVGVAVARIAAPMLATRSGRHLGRLKATWPAVAGEVWAACAWPLRLGQDGVLKLRVIPPAALELQHRAPLLIERINLFLGGPVVSRLVLRQAIPARAPVIAGPPTRPLRPEEATALERMLAQVADPELRAALALLGSAVLVAAPTAPGVVSGNETD
jgi:hypothetical protein